MAIHGRSLKMLSYSYMILSVCYDLSLWMSDYLNISVIVNHQLHTPQPQHSWCQCHRLIVFYKSMLKVSSMLIQYVSLYSAVTRQTAIYGWKKSNAVCLSRHKADLLCDLMITLHATPLRKIFEGKSLRTFQISSLLNSSQTHCHYCTPYCHMVVKHWRFK